MSNVILKTRGRAWSGWTSVSVELDVRAVAWSFELGITLPNDAAPGELMKPDDAVSMWYGPHRVITGYVDEVATQYDADTISITVTGRSKTGQLMTSAAVHPGGQLLNVTLEQVAQVFCQKHGIAVRNLADDAGLGVLRIERLGTNKPFNIVRIEQGETVFDLLERLARQRGVLLTTNPAGELVMTRAGTKRATPALRLGETILAAQGVKSNYNRASEYIVKGSSAIHDLDAAQNSGRAVVIKDKDIALYRPRLIICEQMFNLEIASQRGHWQRCRDLGEGSRYDYTVQGWQCDHGVWLPNHLISVSDHIIGLNEQMLIVAVRLSVDERGELSTLTVQPPEALVITKIQTNSEALLA